jgi:Parvulin-like peptidyl-prolyl isomerase
VQQREVLGHLQMTEEELRQYYDKHTDEFVVPPTVTLRELLIAVPAPAGQANMFSPALDDASKEKANALRERAVQGEDFAKLVAEASESPTKANGGLIGPINVTELATGIRDVIEKMQANEITPPFRTTRGYQLYKLESRTTAIPQPFDAVKDAIGQKVGETRLDAETQKYLSNLRAQAIIEWKRDDLRAIYEKRLAERVKQ